MSKEIGIIGHFGGDENFFDGQTIKTKVLCQELSNRGFDNIFKVDTYYNKTNKVKLMADTLRCFFKCDTVIALLSTNGLKIYLPMLFMAKKIFKIKVFHDVIGGHLHTDISSLGKKAVDYLNSFDSNWVETNVMKKQLEDLGVKNCDVFTNFKILDIKKALPVPDENGVKRFCMFSRVMREKGITEAIEAVAKYNEEHENKIGLDIWGSVEDDYKEEFENLLSNHADCVTYGGRIEFDKSVGILSNHMALLFPTKFMGEGCPGTLIDAYASALPVISTNWDAAGEMVKNFETGWIYPNEKTGDLYESICYAMEHTDEMIAMRKNCTLFATRYTPDFVMRRIIEKYLK